MTSLRAQRGSMAITLALLLLGLIAMLGLVEIGYLYWAHRDAQKVADLAALSGAQRLDECSPANVSSVAIQNATVDNHFSGNVAATCGYWSPSEMPAPSYFGDAGELPANAVSVTAKLPLTPFFGFAKFSGVKAEAIAAQTDPVAVFSVGTQLLELHKQGIVPKLLKEVGLDVGGTKLVGYEGLANLDITPSGLLKALCDDGALDTCVDVTAIADVGTLNSVLAGKNVEVGDLLQAMINLANQQHLVDASAALQNLLDAQATVPGPLELIQLGTDSDSAHRGLFAQVKAATAGSALDADVSALDIANVALQIANSRHFVALDVSDIPGVEAKVSVIEPPSIAVGGIGTKAFTSQVRVGAKISTDALPVVGTLLQALGVTLELPIVIDVVIGNAELTGLCGQGTQADMPPTNPPVATFATHTSILDMCVGEFDWNNLPSTRQSCATGLTDAEIVKLLGTPIVTGHTHIPMLENDQSLVVPLGETKSTDGVDLAIGDAVSNLTHGILELIANNALAQHTDVLSNIDGLVDNMWEKAGCTGSSSVSQRKTCMDKIDDMLSKPVSTETTGLVPGLLNLTNGLLSSVGNLLGDLLGGLTGNGCTKAGVLGSTSVGGCKKIIHDTLSKSQPLQNITGSILNAVLAPVAQLLDALSPILNQVGDLLEPLLEKLLGDSPGHTDVHLMSLQCKGTHLVY